MGVERIDMLKHILVVLGSVTGIISFLVGKLELGVLWLILTRLVMMGDDE